MRSFALFFNTIVYPEQAVFILERILGLVMRPACVEEGHKRIYSAFSFFLFFFFIHFEALLEQI